MTTLATDKRVPEIVAKFNGMLDFQDQHLVERRTQLEVVQVALVSRTHIILHGNPGNAKSMTVDGLLRHMPELRLFKTQAYKASPPQQFLGPISLKAMEHDQHRVITTGKFADCEVAYVDETPRAPRAVLPAFQGGMVEREFDDGLGPQPIDLMSFIGTSNHLPEDEELQAFFDRFTFKLVVEPPQAQASFIQIIRGGLDRRANPLRVFPPDDLIVPRAELVALQEVAREVEVPDDVLEALAELWANLLAHGIQPSIRRYNDLVGGLQAFALLRGRDKVIRDDLLLAQHSLWTSEDERDTVYEEVIKFASQWERDKHDLLNAWSDVKDKMTKLQSEVAQVGDAITREMTNLGVEIVKEGNLAREPIERHISSADGRDVSALQRALDEMDNSKDWVQQRLLGGLSL